jgi:hypothetical protein
VGWIPWRIPQSGVTHRQELADFKAGEWFWTPCYGLSDRRVIHPRIVPFRPDPAQAEDHSDHALA